MKKASMAIMLAALLVATIVGVVWARPNQSPQAADIIRKITIPAAFFHPRYDGIDYSNAGMCLAVDSGSGGFTAPVVFPTLSAVTVKKITLSVTDNNAGSDACIAMYRTSPKNLTESGMAAVCSAGSGGATSYDDNTIDNAVVWPAHGPYLWLDIYGTNIRVYGVTIEYQRNT